ncbi:hypothetical protein AcW1_008615 [Taiwanofungus camphoratus]|nr:hypothetical protein AcW1_008615 [Antrodia cinnamomea]
MKIVVTLLLGLSPLTISFFFCQQLFHVPHGAYVSPGKPFPAFPQQPHDSMRGGLKCVNDDILHRIRQDGSHIRWDCTWMNGVCDDALVSRIRKDEFRKAQDSPFCGLARSLSDRHKF